jgi:hypothetical protein
LKAVPGGYFRLIAKVARRPWFWRSCNVPLHTWEFTKETAQACFEGAGFRIVDFRRGQVADLDDLGGMARLIALPTKVLGWGPVKARFGTQMGFLLRKEGEPARVMVVGDSTRMVV